MIQSNGWGGLEVDLHPGRGGRRRGKARVHIAELGHSWADDRRAEGGEFGAEGGLLTFGGAEGGTEPREPRLSGRYAGSAEGE